MCIINDIIHFVKNGVSDMENLRKDRDNVAHDVRRAFENLKFSNG